jgi:hypothetical protein
MSREIGGDIKQGLKSSNLIIIFIAKIEMA